MPQIAKPVQMALIAQHAKAEHFIKIHQMINVTHVIQGVLNATILKPASSVLLIIMGLIRHPISASHAGSSARLAL